MSSTNIKNVAVVGGSGTIGVYIVKELLATGFYVTVLTRDDSKSSFPAGVTVKKVDYSSLESLKEALAGHDAVVSAIATPAIGTQLTLVDAALASGVKRFIPSEFGINTRTLGDAKIAKILAGKIKTVDYLQEKAKENNSFTWTGLSNGLFFDINLAKGIYGYDPKTKTATIYDSGNEHFQTSNGGLIAQAVASILKHPEVTANKYLSVTSFSPSRNEILKILEEETGTKWTVKHEATADLQRVGEEKLEKGDFSAFRELLLTYLHRDGSGHALKPEDSANELLELPQEDLRATLRKWLADEGAI
ncbi:putative -like family protein [Phaeoacremonium minimum UCRPA7]|uniref:Putative-like family protein n=1 Tax=Phaeoacremonium minimum (strain UCR-PA7) TaxID=1286976 RepID=R8BSR0_PHAM7|nr:putative -like family protein [Phaeoacremonium minimum UCRPA7]EOO02371.1 putative -like family protein [Phaeoacremonium minimum UCRPA7]